MVRGLDHNTKFGYKLPFQAPILAPAGLNVPQPDFKLCWELSWLGAASHVMTEFCIWFMGRRDWFWL